jgi:hypothetical protein
MRETKERYQQLVISTVTRNAGNQALPETRDFTSYQQREGGTMGRRILTKERNREQTRARVKTYRERHRKDLSKARYVAGALMSLRATRATSWSGIPPGCTDEELRRHIRNGLVSRLSDFLTEKELGILREELGTALPETPEIRSYEEREGPPIRTSSGRKDPDAPYDPKTKGQIVRANAQKRTMLTMLGGIGVSASLLPGLDVQMALSVCSDEEIAACAAGVQESLRNLQAFPKRLSRVRYQERQRTRQEVS